jgi:hypothetical protein
MLCAEIVTLKNEQDPSVRRLARCEDVEAAIPEALNSGSLFFDDIERNQIDSDGLAILRFVAAQGEAAIVKRGDMGALSARLDDSLTRLKQRDLIMSVDGGYSFQVELIRRWFAR